MQSSSRKARRLRLTEKLRVFPTQQQQHLELRAQTCIFAAWCGLRGILCMSKGFSLASASSHRKAYCAMGEHLLDTLVLNMAHDTLLCVAIKRPERRL